MSRGKMVVGAWILAISGVVFAFAQKPHDHENKGKMGPGMMESSMGMMNSGMMSDPLGSTIMTAFILPKLDSELGLSTQQVAQLSQMKQDLLTKGKSTTEQIGAKQTELGTVLNQGTSKGIEVKRLLEQIANLRAQQQYAAYDTAARMKAALTDAQRTKLEAMKPFELRQSMMSHMSVKEMMEMMQFMGEGGMMMRGGMMGMMGMTMNGGMPEGIMARPKN